MLVSSDVATPPTFAAIANCNCKRMKSQVITHYYALRGHSVLSTACPDPSDLLRGVRLGQPTSSRRKTRGHGIGNGRNSSSSKEASTIEINTLGKQAGGKEELSGHLRHERLRTHRGTGGQPSLCQWTRELFGFSGNLWKAALVPRSWRGPSGRDKSVGRRVQAAKE